MNPRFKVSRAGIELLKDFEGLRRESAQLPDGRWTIGYGHTRSARAGVTITESDAAALLQYDLIEVVAAVNDWVFTPMTQNQFDALVCFAFNVGLDRFKASTVLRRVNEGSMLQAAWSLEMWRKAEFEGHQFVVDALVRRRAAEKALFLTPADGWVAAPSPVLPPQIDDEVCRAIPKEKPADLRAALEGTTATVTREDTPVETAPVAEAAPAVEAPADEATVFQAPAAETSFAEAPIAEAPVAEAPVVESPTAAPHVDEPAPAVPTEPVLAAAAVTGAVAYAAEHLHHEPEPVEAAAAPEPAEPQPAEPAPLSAPLSAPLPHQMADATQALSARLEAILPNASDETAGVVAQPEHPVEPQAEAHAEVEAQTQVETQPQAEVQPPAEPQPAAEARPELDLPSAPAPVAPVAYEPVQPAPVQHAPVDYTPIAPPEPVLFERPVVQSRWLPDPIAYSDHEPAHEPVSADLFQGPVFREEHHGDDFDHADVQPAKLGFAPFLALAFFGLIVFAAAATFAFNSHASSTLVIGVGFGLVGIACVGWAVYSLLSKFGEWEE